MYSRLTLLSVVSVLSFVLSGCINDTSDSGSSVNEGSLLPGTVMRTSAFDESEQCPAGGVLIELGTDTNKDGTLQDSEVEQSQEICNGLSGTDGTDGIDGADGVNGAPGQDGADGQDGTNGRTSLILVEAVPPGHATCEYGGVQIDVGLEDENTAGTIDPDTQQTTFLCRETPECTWQDNGDGTALVTCNGDTEYTVLTANALDIVETISCTVQIPRPGTDGSQSSLMFYTIDTLASSLKFVRLTIIDGASEYSTSRLIASNMPDFDFSRIRAFYDIVGDPNGGFFTAQLNEPDNEVVFIYSDLDIGDNPGEVQSVLSIQDAFVVPIENSPCRRQFYD